MKKHLVFRLLLSAVVFFVMHSCRTEDELNPRNTENGTPQYGISGEAFLNTVFITNLKNSKASKNTNSQKMASDLTADELMQRLYLEGAHLNSGNGKEVLHVPVITPGTYKRTLLSISENGHSTVFLFTYPTPDDHRFFYITDLQGNLLKEVRIGDDGKEIANDFSKKTTGLAEKSGDCSVTIYTTCSSGEHSFESGNAYECSFWHNLGSGSPPTLLTQSGDCGGGGFGGGGGGSGGGGSSGGGGGGGGTSPVGGGPRNQLTHSDCIQNLDCGGCNIPGDTDNDCVLSYAEAMAFNNDPCVKTEKILANPNVASKIKTLKEKASIDGANEFGFKMKTNGTTTAITEGKKAEWDVGNLQDIRGFYHSHPGAGINIFSPPDIQSIFTLIITSGSPNNVSNNFIGVIGTEDCPTCPGGIKYFHYILQYNGTIQEAGTISSTNYDMKNITNNYQKRENELTSILPVSPYSDNDGASLNHKGVEKLFFATLDIMNIDKNKIILQRVDDDGIVNIITPNSDGTTTSTPCL